MLAATTPQRTGSSSAFEDSGPLTPIAELTPYKGKRWRIKGRVTLKGDIRRFNNARGPGQLFKIDITDKDGSEISGVFFGPAVDDFYPRLQMNKVYNFSNGFVKPANARFEKGQFTINFEADSQIDEAGEDETIPGVRYNFKSIAEVQDLALNTEVDVKAVISDVGDVASLTMKGSGQQRSKRALLLWDASGPEGSSHIELTLWGEKAETEWKQDSVVFVRGVHIREWQGQKTLGFHGGTCLESEPTGQVAHELAAQWASKGQPRNPAALKGGGGGSKRVTVQQSQETDLGLGPPPVPGQPLEPNGPLSAHRHAISGTLTSVYIERPPFYAACPVQVEGRKPGEQRACNKKMAEESGGWCCGNGHRTQQPAYRYMCRARIADHTGTLQVSCFDEVGQKIFGCEAGELAAIWDDDRQNEELQRKLKRPFWTRGLFNMRSVKESYQDEERVKVTCNDVQAEGMLPEAKRRLVEIRAALEVPSSPPSHIGGA